jgi:hypothetical protein
MAIFGIIIGGGIFAYLLIFSLILIFIAEAGNVFNQLLTKPAYFRKIWPNKVDSDTGHKVKVNFKVKTSFEQSNLLETLNRAEINPMIAVTEDAIVVNSAKEVEGQEGQGPEPVIYSRHGNMVAIHSQTGEFADEESIMRIVAN